MAEHAESGETDAAGTATRTKRRIDVDWRRVKDTGIGLIAGIVRWVGLILAAVLVLDVIFVVGSANPGNGIVSWVSGWAETFSIGFKDLFEPDDAKLRVLVNYGIAALFWLIASAVVARIVRRAGGVTA